jgi:hypothetical protein
MLSGAECSEESLGYVMKKPDSSLRLQYKLDYEPWCVEPVFNTLEKFVALDIKRLSCKRELITLS